MESNDNKVIDYANTSEFMTFELGAMKYAIELPKIREILTYPDNITPLPNTSKWVKGLIQGEKLFLFWILELNLIQVQLFTM